MDAEKDVGPFAQPVSIHGAVATGPIGDDDVLDDDLLRELDAEAARQSAFAAHATQTPATSHASATPAPALALDLEEALAEIDLNQHASKMPSTTSTAQTAITGDLSAKLSADDRRAIEPLDRDQPTNATAANVSQFPVPQLTPAEKSLTIAERIERCDELFARCARRPDLQAKIAQERAKLHAKTIPVTGETAAAEVGSDRAAIATAGAAEESQPVAATQRRGNCLAFPLRKWDEHGASIFRISDLPRSSRASPCKNVTREAAHTAETSVFGPLRASSAERRFTPAEASDPTQRPPSPIAESFPAETDALFGFDTDEIDEIYVEIHEKDRGNRVDLKGTTARELTGAEKALIAELDKLC